MYVLYLAAMTPLLWGGFEVGLKLGKYLSQSAAVQTLAHDLLGKLGDLLVFLSHYGVPVLLSAAVLHGVLASADRLFTREGPHHGI